MEIAVRPPRDVASIVHQAPEMPSKITRDMLETAASGEFPRIDLGDYAEGTTGPRERVARQLRHALENIGFLIVVNHGIPADLIDGIAEQARRFHALPYAEKIKLATKGGNGAGFTGYLPSGEYVIRTSRINDNDQPDVNAAFFMDRERAPDDPEVVAGKLFREPNKWPADLPGFREFLLTLLGGGGGLCEAIAAGVCGGSGSAAAGLRSRLRGSQCVLRLSHFPPAQYRNNQFRFGASHRCQFLHGTAEVECRRAVHPAGRRSWLKAPRIPGSLIINSGDMCRTVDE
jgi:isopenicillin N synthase-like dioxygenase